MRRPTKIGALLVLWAAAGMAASAQDPEPRARTTVGIEGRVSVEHAGPALQVQELREDAVLLLRIGETEVLPDGRRRTELRFLARRPGDYDLRQVLSFGPDRPVGDALAPLPVRVDSLLPEDHQGELEELEAALGVTRGGFRRILTIVLLLWLTPLALYLAWRWRRRPRQVPEPIVPEPTLAERLRPLVEAARHGQLDLAEQARLERLLLGFWREQLELGSLDQAAAIRRIRADREAGQLLRTVEEWLHRPADQRASAARVEELLARYAEVGG